MSKRKFNVLIVEDEQSILEALETKFKNENFLVARARNGKEGLELALRDKPDVILLDIVMPKMDGLAMLDKLRDDSWGKGAPVFILTNLADLEKMGEAVKNSVAGYYIKSDTKLGEIVTQVKERLNQE